MNRREPGVWASAQGRCSSAARGAASALDYAPANYRAMNEREALKVMVKP